MLLAYNSPDPCRAAIILIKIAFGSHKIVELAYVFTDSLTNRECIKGIFTGNCILMEFINSNNNA